MLRKILIYGAIAGLVAGVVLSITTLGMGHNMSPAYGMALGYASMLVALSAVFVGIKRYRDAEGGGVIGFWPALGMGLAISFVAGILYVLVWELAQAITQIDFAESYGNAMIAREQAKGVSAEVLAKVTADMARFKLQYADPLYRLPMVFAEIFPVGILVSLVSAGLLRNPRILPARR